MVGQTMKRIAKTIMVCGVATYHDDLRWKGEDNEGWSSEGARQQV
jgi:hypothetical protein